MISCMVRKKLKTVHARRGSEKQEIRHLGVMMEAMNDNIMLLAEGQGIIVQRLDRLEVKVDVHTEMIAELAQDVHMLKEDMKEVKEELAKKADKEDLIPIVERMSALEAAR
jgi:hypothetical protein